MKRGSQQAAKSDESRGAAKGEPSHDEDETKAEHSTPQYLPISLDLLLKFRNWQE